MNLSCGNCKTIRSFSGQPLKCDVCGWQVSQGKWQVAEGTIVPKKKNDTPWISTLVIIGAIVFFVGHYWLDSDTRVVPVHMSADHWIVGEFRKCVSLGTKDDANGDFRSNVSDIAYLDCDDTTESHDLQVKFTNSSSSGEKKARRWNCQRQQLGEGVTSLDCKLEAQ
jgi:hypothetical protein